MLKALELYGFKSFADRTRLEFPAGVTAVVGPNGSGKSNVVDGIKWVLGSQSPKSLRGSEMTDVIFNGSTSRRPLNTAEVSLEFDNTLGLFPAGGPIAEGEDTVRLTRRVYRSGEGEYLINGAVVRLRDLRDLLAGTGMGGQGSGSYGIIEQGRVDAVLQSSASDRRALFEEAAGISRFRIKKQEAARRLARVEQNLLRLSDIVDEVEGRLRRVRAQAGKAQRYREQAERLKQLRTELGLADWRALTAGLSTREAELKELATKRDAAQSELAECEVALEAHEQQTEAESAALAEGERRLAATREAIAIRQARLEEATRRYAKGEQEVAHARRQAIALESNIEADEEDDTGESTAELSQRLELAQTEAAAAEQALLATQADRQAAREAKQQLSEQVKQAHREVVKTEERLAVLVTGSRDAGASLESLRAAAEESAAEHQATTERRDAASQQVTQRAADVEQAAAALSSARQELASIRERLTSRQRDVARAEADLVGVNHRSAAIEELEQKLEKLADDIRGVLTAEREGEAPTVHGMVADLLHVDYDTAPMIEAALGASAQHLVVDAADRLVAALAGGEANLRVRASFQRLDATAAATALDRIDLSGEPGVMGRAVAFVDSDLLYEPLVQRLLGRTWFVDSLATAARLSNGSGRGLTFVTYGGEVLSGDGAIFVGPKADDAGLITNRRQAGELQEQRERLEQEFASASNEAAELELAVAKASGQEHALLAAHTKQLEQLATHRQELAGLDERVASLSREVQQRREALESTRAKLQGQQQEQLAAEQAVKQATSEEQRVEQELAGATQQVAAAEAAVAECGDRATDARVVLAKAEHDLKAIRAETQEKQRDDSKHRQLREEIARQLQRAVEQASEGKHAALALRSELAELYLERDHLAAKCAANAHERRQDQQLRRRGLKRVQVLRDAVTRFAQQAQRCELEAGQSRHQRDTLQQRMQEDYDIDLAQAAASAPPTPDAMIEERGDLERELQQLREQVQSIGPVNADALEELDDLEGRFEQLSGQYQDLLAAKSSLERLTSRINADSRELFLATIETVREHFRELFRRLFGGGEADLVLLQDEAEDVLDCGVEIVAQPPGKELSSISLLSGGEKTMTCVALLLALFRTKPSPFCVLDEVDAALDEANIGRFTSVITEFLASTQFLVVTHSKKTMIGAGTIYGITMQESGISTRVGVRFEDVGENGQLRVASDTQPERTQPERRAA